VNELKIQPNISTFGSNVSRGESSTHQPVQSKSFAEMMNQNGEQTNHDQLRRMLNQIELQGQRLAKSMTVRELRAYKLLVKRFLEDTVRRGVGLKETSGWDRRGRTKRYKLLEEVDALLLLMAEEMLQDENGRIELLSKVGEIRGMLLNAYF
jgi:uncharacterized protein YaaR (DUF327 family)